MTVTSRTAIAESADRAASEWVRACAGKPSTEWAERPANPHDAVSEPEHHAWWRADFNRALLKHSCPDGDTCEGGA